MAKKKKKGGIRGELSVLAVATADREGAIVRVESGTILSRSKRYKSQRYDIHGSPLTKILSIRVPDNVPIPKDITDLEGCEVQITHRPEETVLDEDSGKFFYLYNPIQSFVGVKGKRGWMSSLWGRPLERTRYSRNSLLSASRVHFCVMS
jgi:hypothetical protein